MPRHREFVVFDFGDKEMDSNLSKLEKDLEKLVKTGNELLSNFLEVGEDKGGAKKSKKASKFFSGYQEWFSEALEVIRQILPNRIVEFETLYSQDKRKGLNNLTYGVQDWLLGRRAGVNTLTGEKVFDDFAAAVMKFQSQVQILESAKARFKSTLFDIQQIVRADLFDSELDGAKELLKNGFLRGAGAIAGVVLEKHLAQVCASHSIPIRSKQPTIATYNDALKNNDVIDIPKWRFIQRLGDLRNLCGHNKLREPKKEEVGELIEGVGKITKTIF